MLFNPQLILPSYQGGVESIFQIPHETAKAEHFTQELETEEFHNKVVIGRLLSISTPNPAGMHFGHSLTVSPRASAALGGSKRPKIMSPVASFAFILVFADQMGGPNCFALILTRKLDFQTQFGTDIARSELVRVGDVFAIKDPRPSDDNLGDSNLTILKEPQIVVGVVPTGWAVVTIQKANDVHHQVFFDEPGKTIQVFGAHLLLTSDRRMTCNGYTCDRQNLLCKGCFGKSPTKKPIVLECDVDILDAPNYREKNNKACFRRFTSFRFTMLFFNDIVGLSSMHENVIRGMYNEIQQSVPAMVNYININGGWSVTGWHKRGVVADTTTGEQLLSVGTMGHIILLQPTDMTVLERPQFRALMIITPGNDVMPVVPPVLVAPNINPAPVMPNNPAGPNLPTNQMPAPVLPRRTAMLPQQHAPTRIGTTTQTPFPPASPPGSAATPQQTRRIRTGTTQSSLPPASTPASAAAPMNQDAEDTDDSSVHVPRKVGRPKRMP